MDIQDYIDSGVLKMYILGQLSKNENLEIQALISEYPELKAEVDRCENELFSYTESIKSEPHPSLQPLVFATFDYIKRLESGEAPVTVPLLNENSTISDFSDWINRDDFVAPEEFEEIHAKIICANPSLTCAMVWIKNLAPEEVHSIEQERFLILEGTCTIRVGSEMHRLVAGDFFAIPLHLDHEVIVTSEIPCKVILQRVAIAA